MYYLSNYFFASKSNIQLITFLTPHFLAVSLVLDINVPVSLTVCHKLIKLLLLREQFYLRLKQMFRIEKFSILSHEHLY